MIDIKSIKELQKALINTIIEYLEKHNKQISNIEVLTAIAGVFEHGLEMGREVEND